MSLISRHTTDTQTTHACGGTILSGPDYDYCDTCGAYAYNGAPVPDGTDREANREAWDAGDTESPAAACSCQNGECPGGF